MGARRPRLVALSQRGTPEALRRENIACGVFRGWERRDNAKSCRVCDCSERRAEHRHDRSYVLVVGEKVGTSRTQAEGNEGAKGIDRARDRGIGTSTFPTIRSVIAGFAWLFSISLIHVLLHFSQTTFAFQSSRSDTHSEMTTPFSSLMLNLFAPGTKSPIQALQRCSPDRFAVSGQNAHFLYLCHFPISAANLCR